MPLVNKSINTVVRGELLSILYASSQILICHLGANTELDFEILGEITDIEVIAVGGSIREVERLRKAYGQAVGENSKALPPLALMMVQPAKPNCTGTKPTVSAKKSLKSSVFWNKPMKFVVCLQNQDYPASLEVRKLYQVLEDPQANQHQMLRIIDESGEDYLYPASYFAEIEVPESIQRVFATAS